ncbi:FAD binding domain-containing protein [Blastococcus brunescens]|uniref:FAD binding domain-containing protein n=1 Tax=Blastococcus brunescens TaxID=1564165 RepID=A0ABZ1B196_9ACTN|nr:FAD binding domain-containing protein [Blastococcus sp. BMG 8361]WRL63518.1 FAD binding domain-containing protein [Blastococcus sp. BMG 8361]
MIPAPFAYARPSTVDEALHAVASGGEDVKILAGGQSLIPVMRLRLAAPETVVDLTRVAELRGVREEGDAIVVGAMTTHSDVLSDPLIGRYAPLIAEATETVADRQVRHRGTFGGALAHADPAGDLPAVALALDAEFVIAGLEGRRTVPASEFFVDYLTTALQEGSCSSRSVSPSARAGGCTTRSSTGWRRRGRSWPSPRRCAWRAAGSRRRGSG